MTPCIVCKAEGECRHKRIDAAILAYRANPTDETHAALLEVQREATDEFYLEQGGEFINRTTNQL